MCHHGRGLFRLTKDESLVEAIKNDYHKADVSAKDMAMLEYAEKLTSDPCNLQKWDFERIKGAGFKDDELLDIVQVVAYFNFVNRLACGLGVELEDYWQDGQQCRSSG